MEFINAKIKKSIYKTAFKTLKNINIKIDDFCVRKILSFKYNFLISFNPVMLNKIIKTIFPRAASIIVTLQYKHSLEHHFLWNQFNTIIKFRVCQAIRNKETIAIQEFKFFINAIQMPITVLLLFQIFDFMSEEQKKIFLGRVQQIIQLLTYKNQDLYCKQLLYLLIKFELSESTILACVDVIKSSNTDIICDRYSSYYEYRSESFAEPSKISKPRYFLNAIVYNEDFFSVIDNTYIFGPKIESTDNNFFKINLFFLQDALTFIYFTQQLNHFEKQKKLKNATLFLTNNLMSAKYMLFNTLIQFLSCKTFKNITYKKYFLIPNDFDLEMIKYLKLKFNFAEFHKLNTSYLIENLMIINSNKPGLADAAKRITIKKTLEENNFIDPKIFKNKTVVLTNSFLFLTEKEHVSLTEITKKNGCVFIDINIAPFEEIICAFLYASIVICGEHPILEFLFLRENQKTIILQNPSLDESYYQTNLNISNITRIYFKNFKPEILLL